MSTQKPNLTSKFSRRSLKKANPSAGAAKVHSREEELARATNKRFNSDSWRKVSRTYQPFPTGGQSLANTQILCALSSLTEDQAFQTGSSDIPVRSASSFAGGSAYLSARESPSFSRNNTPSPGPYNRYIQSHPSQRVIADSRLSATVTHTTGAAPLTESRNPTPSRATSKPLSDDGKREPQASQTKSPRKGHHVPRFDRKVRQGRLPKSPLKGKSNDQSKAKPRLERQSRSNGSSWNNPVLMPFIQLFKMLKYIVMLPFTIRNFLTKPRWSIEGKSILITGASSGIGAEIARQYAAEGAKLALISRTEEDLDQVAQECRGLGSDTSRYYAADLSNPVSTKLAMKQAIKDFGTFDVVVLNAGRSQGCFFEEIKDPSQIENMIKLNINGAITTLHYVLPQVPKTQDSRIVVISNSAGIVAAPYQTIYSATKHALTGFANSLRMELQNTYGKEAPQICLVNFPEVAGTKSNNARMDMGAKLPPTKWYSWAGIPLPQAVRELLSAIASGKREFGQSRELNMWRAMYAYCPQWVDHRMMKHIQETHYRPLDEKKGSPVESPENEAGPVQNKSWTC